VQNAKFAAAIFLGHLIFKHAHTLDKKRKKEKRKNLDQKNMASH
jgi:hypothetical protein